MGEYLLYPTLVGFVPSQSWNVTQLTPNRPLDENQVIGDRLYQERWLSFHLPVRLLPCVLKSIALRVGVKPSCQYRKRFFGTEITKKLDYENLNLCIWSKVQWLRVPLESRGWATSEWVVQFFKKIRCRIYENAFRFKLVFTRLWKIKPCFWTISNNFRNCAVRLSHDRCIFQPTAANFQSMNEIITDVICKKFATLTLSAHMCPSKWKRFDS